MTPVDALSPDQRAVLQLLLKQGKRYEELAALLRIDASAVRQRAVAALERLGPETELSAGRRAELTDWLLGQQDEAESRRTVAYVEEHRPALAWAAAVADALEASELGGARLPALPEDAAGGAAAEAGDGAAVDAADEADDDATDEVGAAVAPGATGDERPEGAARSDDAGEPSADDAASATTDDAPSSDEEDDPEDATGEPAAARPSEPAGRETPGPRPAPGGALPGFGGPAAPKQPASKLGGALLLAGIAIVLAVALVWALGHDGDDGADTPTVARTLPSDEASTTETTPSDAVLPVAQINLYGVDGSDAIGVARLYEQGDERVIGIDAEKLARNTEGDQYALWLTGGPNGSARRLGFIEKVGRSGRISVATTLPANADRFKRLVISLETTDTARQPAQPTLAGRLRLPD